MFIQCNFSCRDSLMQLVNSVDLSNRPCNLKKYCQRHNGPEGWVHITSSYTNLGQVSISESRLSINIKILNQTPVFRLNFNLKSWPNLASESWPRFNFNFKILTKIQLQLQNLDQTLYSKSEQKFSFMTKPQLPSLKQTVTNTILIIKINNSNNLNRFWAGNFTRQDHINQVYYTGVSESVSDSVSQLVTSIANDRTRVR